MTAVEGRHIPTPPGGIRIPGQHSHERPHAPPAQVAHGTPPIIDGMHFHDLRHSHKTWLIDDGIPEIAQAAASAGVRGIYSHATPVMDEAIVDALAAPPALPTRTLVRAAA